jgi:hypothetical protein
MPSHTPQIIVRHFFILEIPERQIAICRTKEKKGTRGE